MIQRNAQCAIRNWGAVGARYPIPDSRFPIQNPAASSSLCMFRLDRALLQASPATDGWRLGTAPVAGIGCRVSGIGHRPPDDDAPIASGGSS